MSPESSAKIFFDRALNRGRRTESRVLFGYFLHDAKSDKPFSLSGAPRFSKPRFSSPQLRFRTNKIKTFPKGAPRFCKPRSSSPQRRLRIDKIKSFPKEIRGFPNLESAHTDKNFAQTKLNPFSALRRLFCGDFAAFGRSLPGTSHTFC